MECPHCGEDAVIDDRIEGSICTECGLVVSDQTFEDSTEGFFRNAPSNGSLPVGISGSILAIKRDADKKENFYSSIGLEELEITCHALGLGTSDKEESEALYKEICDNPSMNVKYRSRDFKQVLGACCVYITLRKHEFPVTAKDLVTLRKLSINNFLVMLRRLKKYMQIDFPKWSIGQQTVHTLQRAKFSKDIIERTQSLIQICDKCWLVTGKNPEEIIKSAAFLSWLSFQEPKHHEKSIDFKTFCKSNSLTPPRSRSGSELKQMKNILTEMAKCIPWILNFQPSNLQYYISDIVKYKSSLMRKAFKRSVGSSDDDDDYDDDESKTDILPCKKRKEEVTYDKSNDDIDAEIHEKYGDTLDSTELNPTEFEDEMTEYIKTDQEKRDADIIRNLASNKKNV